MARKSWHLDRRTFLRGAAGTSLALPWMEAMAVGKDAKAELPKRFCAVYFPYGISLKNDGWGWFPTGEGKNYRFTEVLKSMEPLRKDITVIGGTCHPRGKKMGGHATVDIWLTGGGMKDGALDNSISLDQLVGSQLGKTTRYSALSLSSDGGTGQALRSNTLSYTSTGSAVPALSSPRQIYNLLFGKSDAASKENQELKEYGSMVDLVHEHSKSINKRLGKQDQMKFDEFLTSLRTTEKEIERAEQWLHIPKPKVDDKSLPLNVTQQSDPEAYMNIMYDLMFHALRTDSTRSVCYLMCSMVGKYGFANHFPKCIGLPGNWHGMAHAWNKPGGSQNLGKFLQFIAQIHAGFLHKLAKEKEGSGSLLDRTIVLYGSSNSSTHNNQNYPLLLAGGRNLGLKHGQYLRYNDSRMPMSNLFLTILHRLGIPAENFADSTGECSDIVA